MRLSLALVTALTLAPAVPALAGDEPLPTATQVDDAKTRAKLLGERPLTLQWIESKPGRAEVTDDGGLMRLRGQQNGPKGDKLTVEGVIKHVGAKHFVLVGTITTQVSYIYGGKTCSRTGTFTFRQTGKRKYFRLKEMNNPCEGGNLVDYVDVFP